MDIMFLAGGRSPILDLNFSAAQAYAAARGPLPQFTRASTATYMDRNGVLRTATINEARIDYDAVTGNCKGLLIEGQSRNLQTYSEDLSQSWTLSNASLESNAVPWITGATVADRLYGASGALRYIGGPIVSFSAGVYYSFSIYAKAHTSSFLQLTFTQNAFDPSQYANFNLTTGVATGTGGTASITSAGNGWYRCCFTAVATTTASGISNALVLISSLSDTRLTSLTSAASIYLCGAQIEAVSWPSSYIPTTSGPATREADFALYDASALGALGYNPAQGSIVTEFDSVGTAASGGFGTAASVLWAGLSSNATNERIHLWVPGGNRRIDIGHAGLNWQCNAGSYTSSNLCKMGVAYNQTGAPVMVIDGALQALTQGTGVSYVSPVVDSMTIGSANSGNQINGHIRRVRIYRNNLQSSQLILLTT